MSQMNMNEQLRALSFARLCADSATAILNKHATGYASDVKADGTPVTDIDLEIESMVHDLVSRERPREEVLGEEGTQAAPTGNALWVVDPIDGTELFVEGLPGYVFSIALVLDGKPEVALVRDPRTGRTWHSAAGGGTWQDNYQIHVSTEARWRFAGVRMPRAGGNHHQWPDVVSTVDRDGVTTLRMGSVIRSAMDVASGRIDGLIFGRSGPWDMAAAGLMIPEAGGRFTDLAGADQRLDGPINGAVLSNGWLHEDLVKLVAEQ